MRIEFADCSESDIDRLVEALEMIKSTHEMLKKGYGSARSSYFGKNGANLVAMCTGHISGLIKAPDTAIKIYKASALQATIHPKANAWVMHPSRANASPRPVLKKYSVINVHPNYLAEENSRRRNIALAGTLYHEMSHLFLKTADTAYGKQNCLALARDNPASALNNADNYCWYLRDVLADIHSVDLKQDLDGTEF